MGGIVELIGNITGQNKYFVSILRARSMTFGVRAPKLYPAATVRHRTR
jgi:hypothetical protein